MKPIMTALEIAKWYTELNYSQCNCKTHEEHDSKCMIIKQKKFIPLNRVEKVIDDYKSSFNKKENFRLDGSKCLCCMMTLEELKRRLMGEQ